MLTNKKNSIRVFALVLALLMAVAVFAGCSSDPVVEDEQARADAEAAKKAAEEAKASAESIAKDLADKLAALDKTLGDVNDSVNNVGDKVDKGDKELQDQINKWHNGETTTIDPDIMLKPDQGDVTNEVSDKVLAQFTELKNRFLVTRKTWYTTENLAALNEIFEKASFELYRVTTAEGVEALLADTETKANAVANIISEAAAVQALIAKFGDVPKTLFTTNEGMVTAARTAFDKWVNDYATCFFTASGFTFVKNANGTINIASTGERKIVDFARSLTNNQVYINVNDNTNSLLYAEAKLAALYAYAEDAIKGEMVAQLMISGGKSQKDAKAIVEVLFNDNATGVEMTNALAQYKTVKALVEKTAPTYAQCKKQASLIEDCYEVYRIFWNANGGDDTPIADDHGLLTGEQFVKLYVLCLYDGELVEYENLVFEYMYDYFVPFFLNAGDASALKTQTGWNFLSLNTTYAEGYDSKDYWSALNTVKGSANVTLAVEFASIDVYVDGVKTATIPADGQKIEREFKRVIAAYNAQVLAMDYSSDFKGKKSLEDAYVEIDTIVAKAVVDMVDVWYDNVFVPYIASYSDSHIAAFGAYDKTASDVYSKHDSSFYTQVSNLLTAANAELKALNFKTYEDLKIADQRVFNVVEKNEAIDSIKFNTTVNSVTASENSAFAAILSSAFNTLDTAILAYDNVKVDVELAEKVHNKATEYAKELDELVGIYDSTNKNFTTESQLIKDFGASYKAVVGADNYKEVDVYNKLVAARDTAVADILSVKLLNDDGTLAIDKESYAALNNDGEAWYNANSTTLALTTESEDNYAVQVVVDPEIVAEYTMIEKFAKGADAVVLAFCDATRSTVKASLNSDLEFYGTKYFGDLDHVKLEPDMKSFIEYLETLTDFAGVGSAFETASFGLKNQAIGSDAAGTKSVSKTSNEVTTWYLHINAMAKDTDDITGLRDSADTASWYTMTKGNLKTYFSIKNGTVVIDGLKLVQQLSYLKDTLRNGETAVSVNLNGTYYSPINVLYAKYTGTVKDGKFTVAPKTGYEYELNNEHTALYLYRLAEVKDAVTNKVAAVDLLDSGIKAGKEPAEAYAAAVNKLQAIMDQYNSPVSDGKKAADSVDDYSLPIAYQRYYTGLYDWTNYKG